MAPVLTAQQVTPQWLTEQLRKAGHDQVTVEGYDARDVGTGQTGRSIRYALQLGGHSDGVPETLIGKFSSLDPTSKATSQEMKTYRTEVTFYERIAPRISIRVPKCYYAAIDDEDIEHAILMEDLAPAHQGDQIGGCSPEIAHQAVMELVGLAAPTWQDDSWTEFLGRVQDGPFADMRSLYNRTMPGFVDLYAAHMEPGHIRFIQAIGAAERCPLYEFHGEHFALEHYDFRLDNVLIDERSSPPTITTVDWQSVRVGKPLQDVAFFIGSALAPDVRRSVEQDILRDYHRGLLEGGVTGYDWGTCLQDYRKGIFAGFGISVISPVLVVRTERGDQMFMTMASRYAEMALDWDADEFLT
jgi:hypothetical protein